MNVIGLGGCGSALAACFLQYPQYTVYCIDTDDWSKKGAKSKVVKKHKTPEEYEEKFPSLKSFLKGVEGEVLFIVGGSGSISGASLRVLEQVRGCEISVLYVQPNREFLTGNKKLQENVTFGVFQEYARSGLFKRLYLVSNESVVESLGDISISDYYEVINEGISSTLHMINVWNHSDFSMGNLEDEEIVERICTFGVVNIDSGEEKSFYPLKHITCKKLYYAINEKSLKNEKHLFKQITDQVKVKMGMVERTTYGIYPTDYQSAQVYFLAFTKVIQNEKVLDKGF